MLDFNSLGPISIQLKVNYSLYKVLTPNRSISYKLHMNSQCLMEDFDDKSRYGPQRVKLVPNEVR